MSLNQSFISNFSEYYRWSQRTKIKYKLHYGWCTGRRFTAATRHNTSCSEVKQKSCMSIEVGLCMYMNVFFIISSVSILCLLTWLWEIQVLYPTRTWRNSVFTTDLSLRFLSEQQYITIIADLILMNGPWNILRQKNKNKTKQKTPASYQSNKFVKYLYCF